VKRGEIWTVDFGPPMGPEQAGVRPAIILQDDAISPALRTVIVLPLTTNLKTAGLPSTVRIASGIGGLPKESVALCHQIQVRGKIRLLSKIGVLPEATFREVVDCLLHTIGL
jgi:mRNA interferase MazF